jgi:hypothetical protein
MIFEDPTDPTLTQVKEVPSTALCLAVPDTEGEELVVHREKGREFVFLFESLDDAYDCCLMAGQALGFMPRIVRSNTDALHFRFARYKPAGLDTIDLPLKG